MLGPPSSPGSPNSAQHHARPSQLLSRYPSFSKRHASFNSPREVPLPSPALRQVESDPFSELSLASYTTPSEAKDRHPKSVSRFSSPLLSSARVSSSYIQQYPLGSVNDADSINSSHSRTPSPYGITPDDTLYSPRRTGVASYFASTDNPSITTTEKTSATSQDGQFIPADSALSFPPLRPYSLTDTQSQTFNTALASYMQSTPPRSTTWLDRYSSSSLPLPSQIPFYALPQVDPATSDASDGAGQKEEAKPYHYSSRGDSHAPKVAPINSSCSFSGSSSSSSSSGSLLSSSSSLPPPNHSGSTSPPCSTAPSPSVTSTLTTTGFTSGDDPRMINSSLPTVPTPTAMRQPPASSSPSYPSPEPPTILPADIVDDASHSPTRTQAPYRPFLSHAPSPPDTWIEVETSQGEYKLNVHLPGFSREGITLATKRRRILHVVADNWDNGGGHFERRVSFGYDADLIHVRAEFNGEMLRVVIPRRLPPVFWNARSGP